MMNIFLFVAASALSLIAAGASLVQNADTTQAMFLPSWMEGIDTLWIPFIFAMVIVGFAALAFQQIKR